MGFPSKVLGRPESERAFAVFPVGYPADDCVVPDIARKPLDEVVVDPPASNGRPAAGGP